MVILSISSFFAKSKSPRLNRRQLQLVEYSWKLCQPRLTRLRAKAPHHAPRIEAILSERIRSGIHSYNPVAMTLYEWSRVQFRHALVEGISLADDRTVDAAHDQLLSA